MKLANRPVQDCTIGQHDREHAFVVDESGVAMSKCRHCGCRLKRLPWSRQWYCADQMG